MDVIATQVCFVDLLSVLHAGARPDDAGIQALGGVYWGMVPIANELGANKGHAWSVLHGLWTELVYHGGYSMSGGLLNRLGSPEFQVRPEDLTWLDAAAERAAELAGFDDVALEQDERLCWLADVRALLEIPAKHRALSETHLRARMPGDPTLLADGLHELLRDERWSDDERSRLLALV